MLVVPGHLTRRALHKPASNNSGQDKETESSVTYGHLPRYRRQAGYHQTDDIHDAVTFVEQLRNDNGVEHARIFRLEEVNFEYRPYFRVELKAGDPALGAPPAAAAVSAAPAVSVAAAAAPAITDTPKAEVAPEPVATAAAPAAVETKVDDAAEAASSKVADVTDTDSKIADAKDAVTSKASDVKDAAAEKASDNGVGARRGLFGR